MKENSKKIEKLMKKKEKKKERKQEREGKIKERKRERRSVFLPCNSFKFCCLTTSPV
jgi:hypothetical protein